MYFSEHSWNFLNLSCAVLCLVAQLWPTLWNPMDRSQPSSSVHGVLQARILEWVAISLLRESSRTRDWTHDSYIGRQLLYPWATWEVHVFPDLHPQLSSPLTSPCLLSSLSSLFPSPSTSYPAPITPVFQEPYPLLQFYSPLGSPPPTELSTLVSLTPGGWPLQYLSYLSTRD